MIQIIAPAFYPNTEVPHLRYFLKSAAQHKLQPRLYGLGRPFTTWMDTHVHEALKEVQASSADHILFTDVDVIFLQPMDEIVRRYENIGSPGLLLAMESDGINFGGWLATKAMAIDMLTMLRDMPCDSGNPQTRMRQAATGLVLWWPDYLRQIFRVLYDETAPLKGEPCILHFAGGYTDPERAKLDIIEPYWEAMKK